MRSDLAFSAKWDNVGQVDVDDDLIYKVEGLTPKKTYKFRIRAVNKLGPSEPATFGKPVLAKDPWGTYSWLCTACKLFRFV